MPQIGGCDTMEAMATAAAVASEKIIPKDPTLVTSGFADFC